MYRILVDGTIECSSADEAVRLRQAILHAKQPPAAITVPSSVGVGDKHASKERGREIKQLRVSVGLSQRAVAEKLGTTQATVSTMELGHTPCTQETLERVKEMVAGLPQRRVNAPSFPTKKPLARRVAPAGSSFEELLASDPALAERVNRLPTIDDRDPQTVFVPLGLSR